MNQSQTRSADKGFFVDLQKTADGNLDIVLTDQGSEHFDLIEEARMEDGIHGALCRLVEDHLQAGWELLRPEELAALTSAPILSDDFERDEQGRLIRLGRVFWFPDYQVRDEIDELRDRMVVTFQGVS